MTIGVTASQLQVNSFQSSPPAQHFCAIHEFRQVPGGRGTLQLKNIGVLNTKGTTSSGSQPSVVYRKCTGRPLGASTPVPRHLNLVVVASTITSSITEE